MTHGITPGPTPRWPELVTMKQEMVRRGYWFEIDADGTERMYRPDGTLALTARKKVQDDGQDPR